MCFEVSKFTRDSINLLMVTTYLMFTIDLRKLLKYNYIICLKEKVTNDGRLKSLEYLN